VLQFWPFLRPILLNCPTLTTDERFLEGYLSYSSLGEWIGSCLLVLVGCIRLFDKIQNLHITKPHIVVKLQLSSSSFMEAASTFSPGSRHHHLIKRRHKTFLFDGGYSSGWIRFALVQRLDILLYAWTAGFLPFLPRERSGQHVGTIGTVYHRQLSIIFPTTQESKG